MTDYTVPANIKTPADAIAAAELAYKLLAAIASSPATGVVPAADGSGVEWDVATASDFAEQLENIEEAIEELR